MMSTELAKMLKDRGRLALQSDVSPVLLVVLIMLVVDALITPAFFSGGNVNELLVELAPFILFAMAQTMILLLGGVDLSVGALASLASTMFATHFRGGVGDVLVIAVVVLFCGLASLVTGVLVERMRLPAIIVTLATSFIWGGLALVVLYQPGGFVPASSASWITGTVGPVPSVAVWLVACFAGWSYFRHTASGLRLYATGISVSAARASGLSPLKVYAVTYGIAGVFVGLAGLVLTAEGTSGDPTIGDPFTLASIAAAVIGGVSFFGGKGKMVGAVAGGVIMGLFVNLLTYSGVSSFYQDVGEGVLLLLAVSLVLIRSHFGAVRPAGFGGGWAVASEADDKGESSGAV
jgi:ribose transport system permease protein